jgi:DNA polymerase V
MPIKKESSLTFHLPNFESKLRIPYVKEGVSAGFPSPATDFLGNEIDLNKDILIVDRSLEPQNNKIAVCFIDGEFTVKRIQVEDDCLYLMPENPSYPVIKVTEENELVIWGMVTYVIKSL